MQLIQKAMLVATFAVAACGTQKSEESTAVNTPVALEKAKAEGAALPAVAIVRVPVGTDGKEQNDKAEMRLVESQAAISPSNVQTTFASAAAPAKTIDELDKTTSTESFRGWISWGLSFRNLFVSRQTSWNWRFYRPTYLNSGFNYGYNYGGAIGCGSVCGNPCANPCNNGIDNGYNYYYYNQGFNNQNGYSGQGWDPSVSYNPNQNPYGPTQAGGYGQDPNGGYGQGQDPNGGYQY